MSIDFPSVQREKNFCWIIFLWNFSDLFNKQRKITFPQWKIFVPQNNGNACPIGLDCTVKIVYNMVFGNFFNSFDPTLLSSLDHFAIMIFVLFAFKKRVYDLSATVYWLFGSAGTHTYTNIRMCSWHGTYTKTAWNWGKKTIDSVSK